MDLTATHKGLERAARYAAMAGGFGIIFIAIIVTIDVFLRKFMGMTLGGATEIAGFIFAAGTALSYPYVLFDRANIRIDVAYSRVTTRARAFLDLLGMLLVLYFVSMLTRSVVTLWLGSWEGNARSVGVINISLWFPQFFWMLGYLLFLATALLLTFYAIVGLIRGDWAQVNKVIGVPSVAETIEEETHLVAGGTR